MNESVLSTGNKVGDLAMGYFGEFVEVPFDRDNFEGMLEETQRLLAANTPVICEATFSYGGDLCMVDILRVFGNGVEIIEVKSSTKCADIYLHDMAFQYYVLSMCGLNVRRVSLMYVNNQYVRHGRLDLHELFTLEEHTDDVLEMQNEVADNITAIKSTATSQVEPKIKIGLQCGAPYECGYKQWCWRDVPENSVFDISGMQKTKKWELFNNGIVSFQDILNSGTKISPNYLRQVEYEVKKTDPYIDREAIQGFINGLSYPLYHLDFETIQLAIPPWDDTRPYIQIPTQYSLHIEHRPGEVEHREYLGDGITDPRRAIAEQLCSDIPPDACVLAYNKTFELGRIKALAELFPDLSAHLMSIHRNIQDLMIPFSKGYYYAWILRGGYSIKDVLPALCGDDPELDYNALNLVHNGDEAMNTYPLLAAMPPDEQEQTRYALLTYCRLDTLAMVKTLERLREMCGYSP
jgi:hypothetical protein